MANCPYESPIIVCEPAGGDINVANGAVCMFKALTERCCCNLPGCQLPANLLRTSHFRWDDETKNVFSNPVADRKSGELFPSWIEIYPMAFFVCSENNFA